MTETGEGISLSTIQKIVESYKSRMKKLSEITELADFLFKSKLVYSKELLKWDDMSDEDVKNSLSASEKILSSAKSWNLKNLEKILIEEAIKFNLENNYPESNRGFLLWPLRSALSGKKASPSPFEIADILGKGKTLQRIKEAKELLK